MVDEKKIGVSSVAFITFVCIGVLIFRYHSVRPLFTEFTGEAICFLITGNLSAGWPKGQRCRIYVNLDPLFSVQPAPRLRCSVIG